jgi:hypothetical protein
MDLSRAEGWRNTSEPAELVTVGVVLCGVEQSLWGPWLVDPVDCELSIRALLGAIPYALLLLLHCVPGFRVC